MQNLKHELIESLKAAKEVKYYLSTKDIIKVVHEAFRKYEDIPTTVENQEVIN